MNTWKERKGGGGKGAKKHGIPIYRVNQKNLSTNTKMLCYFLQKKKCFALQICAINLLFQTFFSSKFV